VREVTIMNFAPREMNFSVIAFGNAGLIYIEGGVFDGCTILVL
jgi:hypothetical protein